jgi:hypothetical protein
LNRWHPMLVQIKFDRSRILSRFRKAPCSSGRAQTWLGNQRRRRPRTAASFVPQPGVEYPGRLVHGDRRSKISELTW